MPNEQPSTLFNTIFCMKCPRCGEGNLYSGFLKPVETCSECKLNIGKNDSADGPAYCSMFATSIVVAIFAAVLEIYFEPEAWVHIAAWIPVSIIVSIIFLYLFKPLFIFYQFKFNPDSFK